MEDLDCLEDPGGSVGEVGGEGLEAGRLEIELDPETTEERRPVLSE